MESKLNQAGCHGTKVVLKSDQKESIIAPKKAVAIKRQAETVPIESPVRDSRANGAIERTIRTWAAQVSTLRHHLAIGQENVEWVGIDVLADSMGSGCPRQISSADIWEHEL